MFGTTTPREGWGGTPPVPNIFRTFYGEPPPRGWVVEGAPPHFRKLVTPAAQPLYYSVGCRAGSEGAISYNSRPDLEGLKFIIHLCIFLRTAKNTRSAHEWDLELVSGADLFSNLHYCSSRGRSRGSRALRSRRPQGPENQTKTRGRIYHFIFPQVCPANLLNPGKCDERPGRVQNKPSLPRRPGEPLGGD